MRSRTTSRAFVLILAATALTLCVAAGPQSRPAADPNIPAADLLPNGRAPLEGIITGGQPTPVQLEAARKAGYRTIVNMRPADEPGSTAPDDVTKLGMSYVTLPIAGAADVTEENARRLAGILEKAERPVIIHCSTGNRVGALLAMKAFVVDGKPPEEALALGQAAGLTRLEPVVREKLGLPPASK